MGGTRRSSGRLVPSRLGGKLAVPARLARTRRWHASLPGGPCFVLRMVRPVDFAHWDGRCLSPLPGPGRRACWLAGSRIRRFAPAPPCVLSGQAVVWPACRAVAGQGFAPRLLLKVGAGRGFPQRPAPRGRLAGRWGSASPSWSAGVPAPGLGRGRPHPGVHWGALRPVLRLATGLRPCAAGVPEGSLGAPGGGPRAGGHASVGPSRGRGPGFGLLGQASRGRADRAVAASSRERVHFRLLIGRLGCLF